MGLVSSLRGSAAGADEAILKMGTDKIHKTAIISPKAQLAEGVEVGPYSIIGPNVKIGKGVVIGNSCVIDGDTTIGDACKIFTGAVIGSIPQDLKYKGEKTKVVIGSQNIIREYTTINLGTEGKGVTIVGDHNLIMAYSHIAHDCAVGNNCVLANCATLAGHVTIEEQAVIGGVVAVHQFCRVGKLSIIGGCSKVVQDIPPFSTCDGHPARVYGLNIIGLKRAKISPKAFKELKAAFKCLFYSGLTTSHAIAKVKNDIPAGPDLQYLINFMQNTTRGVVKAVYKLEKEEQL